MTATDLDSATVDSGPGSGAEAGSDVPEVSAVPAASFVVSVPGLADAELEPEPLDPGQIVSGEPVVTGKVLWESPDGRQIRGSGRSRPAW